MADLLKVFVRGEPEPQPSLNARIAGKFPKQFVHFYEANKYPRGHAKAGQTMPWFLWRENVIRTVESVHRPTKVTGPIRLDLDVYYPRPQYLLKKSSPQGRIFHTVKDDCDNLQKLIQDALTHVGVWADDSQISQWGGEKWWVKRGDPCGVWIHVQTLKDDAPVLFEDDEPATIGFPVKDLGKLFEPKARPEGRPKADNPNDEPCRCGHRKGAHVRSQEECSVPSCKCGWFKSLPNPDRLRTSHVDGVPIVTEAPTVLTDWDGKPIRTAEPPEKEVPQRPRPPGWVAPVPMVVPALD